MIPSPVVEVEAFKIDLQQLRTLALECAAEAAKELEELLPSHEDMTIIVEAYRYGQFSDDAKWQMPTPIRQALCRMAAVWQTRVAEACDSPDET